MNDFINILTHGRRLQGAVKELSVEELITVADKLANIIENRKMKEMEELVAQEAKQEKLDNILAQLQDAGLGVEDLRRVEPTKKSPRTGQKRPIKYKLTDNEGSEHTWTGIGRMPKVYAAALKSGQSLDHYSI
ncbi:MAG: DNA-binding protein H-NS [Paraglaciecola sp.]|jgi:DNA-binding protein H-NS